MSAVSRWHSDVSGKCQRGERERSRQSEICPRNFDQIRPDASQSSAGVQAHLVTVAGRMTLTAEEIRQANTRYHDVAADGYDMKWGIDFAQTGAQQVLSKLEKALGRAPGRFGRSLEIGAGTGYFSLNLARAGIVGDSVCTDISPGMLRALEDNARRIGVPVQTITADAEDLPLPDESFDLVFGHAVLHHLPHLPKAFSEFHRVLKPGGTLVFAGEPSRRGDRLASYPKRAAHRIAPLWRALMRADAAPHVNGAPADADHALEGVVDVHAFNPEELDRFARGAGFDEVRVRGEELLASTFGWANRSLESTADPLQVPWLWRQYAYRGYLFFQAVDRALLEPRVPASLFYNLMLAARKPA
jgi:ubiquinone/menaquinone biosynthesis C-methylase UbiE